VARAFHIIVYIEYDRRRLGRVVRSITGVTGTVAEGGVSTLQALFEWDNGGLTRRPGQLYGRLQEILEAGSAQTA